jgi:hypothetical protein
VQSLRASPLREQAVPTFSRCAVVVIAMHAAVAAHAQDDDAPVESADEDFDAADETDEADESDDDSEPAATAKASPAATALNGATVDTYGGVAFGGRVIGVPALLIGGACLGTGLHALIVADALYTSGIGSGGYWTNFGGLIASGVSILPIVVGEIALGAGAFADLLAAMDLTGAEAEGSGMAWTRLATWELAAHAGGAGAGLAIGGILSVITAIVMPSVFQFNATGDAAYSDLMMLGIGTAASGLIVALVAAALAGVSFWLDGATTSAYKAAARGTASSALPATEPSMAMLY